MEQPAPPPTSPSAAPSGARPDDDRAFAAAAASIERLDSLGLTSEAGLALVEPATTFRLD